MRSSNPLFLALCLFGLFATACGEGELTPEERAEYGDEALDEVEQALPNMGGFGDLGGAANVLDEDDDTPSEYPVCPDCYVRVNTSGGYVSSVSPLLMTIRERLPSGSTVSFDKLEVRSSSGLLAQFDLNGFSTSHWLTSQGSFFWAYSVSTTAMPLSQRAPSNWGTSYRLRVKLRYTTPDGMPHDLYFPIAVKQYVGGTWTVIQP